MVKYNLNELLKSTRKYIMTPEEEKAQRISFVYGNTALHNSDITKKMVEEVDKELERMCK